MIPHLHKLDLLIQSDTHLNVLEDTEWKHTILPTEVFMNVTYLFVLARSRAGLRLTTSSILES